MSVPEVITAISATSALIFTGLSLNSTRDQVAIARKQNEVVEQSQLTDRYTKAVEQLDRVGQDHLHGRLGAIYALERLAQDSPRDQPTIIEILSAFVRTSRPTTAGGTSLVPTCPAPVPLTSDVQAALTVLSRRDPRHDNGTNTDLNNVCLNGVNLSGVDLSDVDLSDVTLSDADLGDADLRGVVLDGVVLSGTRLLGADLRGADLSDVSLSSADLGGVDLRAADLSGLDLRGAHLTGADLRGANLSGADLSGAHLSGSDLRNANLLGAHLQDADMYGADLFYADLSGADLSGADLSGADLSGADLSGADLSDTIHDARTVVENTLTDRTTAGHWW